MDQEIALDILRLFDETNTQGWDLHAFFEFVAGDDQAKRVAVFDTVDSLVQGGYLENRGSDFYTLTEKGMRAAAQGHVDE
jgi:predicted transcriptional regulator